jgi:hypothetical protein
MTYMFFAAVEPVAIERMSSHEIMSIIGISFALLLAFLGWAYQLGFFSARISRAERDINELKETKKQEHAAIALKIESNFTKIFDKIDQLPCHNPKWNPCKED